MFTTLHFATLFRQSENECDKRDRASIHISIQSLDESLSRWKHLDLFIRITRSVSASLDFLQSAPVSLLGQHFAVVS